MGRQTPEQAASSAKGGKGKAATRAAELAITGGPWVLMADDRQVFITHFQSHGSFDSACRASGVSARQIHLWRHKYSDFDELLRWSQAFAFSEAVSFVYWRSKQKGRAPTMIP